MTRRTVVVATAIGLVGCSWGDGTEGVGESVTVATPRDTIELAPLMPVTSRANVVVEPTSTVPREPAATPLTPPLTSDAPPTIAPTIAPAIVTEPPTDAPPASPTVYAIPVASTKAVGWSPGHGGDYEATDIFVDCGEQVVSPVDGALLEVRTADSWDAAVDNPATRGGRSIAVLGDDGVRYYLAHLDQIRDDLELGMRVGAGEHLGTIGTTGRSSACHVHFGISPPCPGPEWSIRRGVIWPYPYLDDWNAGGSSSPTNEVNDWLASNPDACAAAMADPNAGDS